jgi:hypothetical protein
LGIYLPEPFSMTPDGRELRERIQVQKISNIQAWYSLTSWSPFKGIQIWEPCAHSIACILIHLREGCGALEIHLRCTCDTYKIHLRELAPVAWPAYTCVQPAHHLRDTLASICAQNEYLRAICGPLADLLCVSVIQSKIIPELFWWNFSANNGYFGFIRKLLERKTYFS